MSAAATATSGAVVAPTEDLIHLLLWVSEKAESLDWSCYFGAQQAAEGEGWLARRRDNGRLYVTTDGEDAIDAWHALQNGLAVS